MPGPAPKPPGTRARRNAPTQTIKLSAKGRGNRKAPAWPLRPDMSLVRDQASAEAKAERLRDKLNDTEDRRTIRRLEGELDSALALAAAMEAQIVEQAELEAQLWADLWSTPQAAMWESNGWAREVALYVRCTLRAEAGDLKAASEARQRSDRLGLSPLAMLRLKWEIERTDEAEQRGRQRRATSKPPAKKVPGKKAVDPRQVLRVVS